MSYGAASIIPEELSSVIILPRGAVGAAGVQDTLSRFDTLCRAVLST
jgi:hypothetical protein